MAMCADRATTDLPVWAAVVIPCLNEADRLSATVASLGFGTEDQPRACYLVLVDNGSTDDTLALCHSLAADIGPTVVVCTETAQGYVPARRTGNVVASGLAANEAALAEAVIVQADADAAYSLGYVNAVRDALANYPGRSVMVQAMSVLPEGLAADYPSVFDFESRIDSDVEAATGSQPLDVLVDDKACAYRLSDYASWGGHRREYFSDGSEILAETTRLFIAAHAQGATRLDIDSAAVTHSQRRLLNDAVGVVATAGYPYVDRKPLSSSSMTLQDLEAAIKSGPSLMVDHLALSRRSHAIALTALLPSHIEHALRKSQPRNDFVEHFLGMLPRRDGADAIRQPGVFIEDVMSLVWSRALE